MNNNEIQRYTSILLGKENVETLSDLQLLFNRYMRLAQIKANPNTEDYDTALSESEKKIAEFEERIKNANANMDELVDKKGKYTKEQTDYAKSVAQTMIDDINNTDDVQLKEVLQKQLDSFAKDYHLIIDVDGNITSLEEQIDTIEPDVEINLSATGNDLDSEISDLSKYLQGLRESSDIDVNTDKISAAETILKTLIERKQELEAPAVMNISDDQLNSVNADLQNAITAIQNYQTAVNELDKQKSLGLDTTNAQKAVNDAKAELDSIDDETKKTLKFDIQGLDDAGIQDAINKLDLSAFDDGIQQLTYHFNIDNEEDANAFLDKIAGLPKDTQKITVSVNLDNTSRQTLSLINSTVSKLQSSNPSLSVSVSAKNLQSQATEQSSIPIDGNNTPYKKSVDEAKKYAENQKPEMKIDGNKGPAISAANAAVEEINSMTANVNVGANISSMVSTIQTELNKPHSVNVTANVTTNVKNNSGGTGGGFASGTTITLPRPLTKADKVKNAVAGHLAGLDKDGNLVDSGKSVTDFDAAGAADSAKAEVLGVIGTIPADATAKTVVDYIKEAVTAGAYDDKQIKADIAANTGAIATLNGTGDGSVKKAVSDAVAKIVADAPEAYDTLKEISDWITNHTSDAATMNSQINTNKTDIANLKTLIGTLPDTATSKDIVSYIAEYVSKALADSDLSQYATADALKACVGRVDAIEKKIPTLEAADTANTEAINGVKTRVETAEGKIKALEDDLAVEKPKIAKNATDITALQGLIGDGYEAIPSEKIQALFKVTE